MKRDRMRAVGKAGGVEGTPPAPPGEHVTIEELGEEIRAAEAAYERALAAANAQLGKIELLRQLIDRAARRREGS
jgi:hypothetical protein